MKLQPESSLGEMMSRFGVGDGGNELAASSCDIGGETVDVFGSVRRSIVEESEG